MVIFIRKGSHHSEESKKKIRKTHWSRSEDVDEIKQKLSINHRGSGTLGKKMSPEFCEKMSAIHRGQIPWNKGKTDIYTEETLKQMSDSHKGKPTWNSGLTMDEDWCKKSANAHKDCKHTPETRAKMSESHSGSKHWNWKDGISYNPYSKTFNFEFKEYIRNKFERKCFICNKTEEEHTTRMIIHHITYDKSINCNSLPWKFVVLCSSCNSKANYDRWYWFNLLTSHWLLYPEMNLDISPFSEIINTTKYRSHMQI